MKVLVVEDDTITARAIALVLEKASILVDVVETGKDALDFIRTYDYDLIVLDLMLADINGLDIIRRIRANRIETPVLILSGLSKQQYKISGFDVGADDFMTKPFDKDEFLARVHAIVRRSKGFSQPAIFAGALTLHLSSKEVFAGGQSVRLTSKEYAILELLMLRKGTVLTKAAFLDHLYGGRDEPEAKIIDVFICKLRKKLAQSGVRDVIGTVWGRGYVFKDQNRGISSGLHAAIPSYDREPIIATAA